MYFANYPYSLLVFFRINDQMKEYRVSMSFYKIFDIFTLIKIIIYNINIKIEF